MKHKKQPPLILASRSPRRIKLLTQCRARFIVAPSHIHEETNHTSPRAIVCDLAMQKARSIARQHRCGIVIGADTIVVVRGKIIGKPKNKKDAVRILCTINGVINYVYTGIAVIETPSMRCMTAYEKSAVKMKKFSAPMLRALVGKHMDKAGAYAVQETDDDFVEWIKGDYYNVVGLPMKKLARMLKVFKYSLAVKHLYTKKHLSR